MQVQSPARYASLTKPMTVRGITFKNRVVLASMGLDMAEIDGCMSDDLAQFYRDIIAGGVGGVILSNASISHNSALLPKALKLLNEEHANSLAPLIEDANAQDVVLGVQLQHYGGQGTTTLTRGRAMMTPSGVPVPSMRKLDPRHKVRAMTLPDLETVRTEFADAARRAVKAGAKLVQLQASNGYLLSSFLSKATNLREDDYGGDHFRRARFVIEVVEAVRAAIGPDVALGMRIGINDFLGDEGTVPDDIFPVIPLLEAAGVDLFEVSFCVASTFSKLSEPSSALSATLSAETKAFRTRASVPVGYAGFIGNLADGCALIEDGVVDYIAMARALLADNDLVAKELAGREEEVFRCQWDGACFKDKYNPRYQRVYCCVNPRYLRPE